jgi:hypothetical protein
MQNKTKNLLFSLLILCGVILSSSNVQASQSPILNFSDLINGPKSGLGDGLGEGAIVTIWGNNLGSSQGTSKVYFKDSNNTIREAAHIYYWKNADGQLPGGPSDLYASHQMQEIAFSIPSASADGAGKIYVEVGGVNSTELDFYARSNGIIRFVKTGGVDSGVGSWASPWATVAYATRGNTAGVGDVIYIASDIINASRIQYGANAQLDGSVNNQIAVVSYPGNLLTVTSATTGGIQNYYTQNDWWVLSKIRVKAYSGTIGSSAHGRTIGCEHTQPDGIDANGQAGAIGCTAGEYNARGTNSCDDLKILGNYIHNYGGQTTSNKEHATYFSLRNNYSAIAPEVGWNRLEDNEARFGIHIYDENECGEYTGIFKVHDNWIENQVGAGINIGTQNCALNPLGFRGNVQAYNNILINPGQYSPVSTYGHGIMLYGQLNYMNVKLWNNTIYGYGSPSNTANDVFVIWTQTGSVNNFDGMVDMYNNIIVDTNGFTYVPATYQRAPDNYENNIWYSTNVSPPVLPSWDLTAVSQDPLFTSPSTNDFTLQSTSPAINAGTTLALVSNDFLGVSRPQGISYDIGAFEYISSDPIPESCSDNIQNQDETGIDCGGVCDVCEIPITYGLNNFISVITNWLQIGNETSDVNSDSIVNTRDLGIMMSNWSN